MQLYRKYVPNIVVVGGTGSGKTTISQIFARKIGFGYLDLDQLIVSQAEMAIADIFHSFGEQRFRELEADAIRSCDGIRNHVIVTGAGALDWQENHKALQCYGPLVWVSSPLEAIAQRLVMNPDELSRRPLLADAVAIESRQERARFLINKLQALYDKREEYYAQADITLSCGFDTIDHCVGAMQRLVDDWSASRALS